MPKAILQSGLKIHYQQVGTGPDLVMIHGLTGNLAVWHLKIVPLLMDDFRVLTYDLRGHGYSDTPPTGYSATDMASDLLQLLDELGIEEADIVGHSFGADTALYFAHRCPDRVRQLVAIEPALPALLEVRRREDWVGWSYWAEVLEQSGQSVPPDRRTDTEYLLRKSLNVPKKWGPLNGLPRDPRPFLRLLDHTTLAKDYESIGELALNEVPRIQVPVHLMYTEGTAFVETQRFLQEHLPNARSIVLPRTEWGHFGPLEQPEVVVEHLRNIFDQSARFHERDGVSSASFTSNARGDV
ncbi:MAG: alpha/beta hydrolase [Isosphaeraceae bacterium]